jgi:hypothetical protein
LQNIGRLVVFGCGGVLALCALVALVVVLAGGGDQKTADEEQKAEPVEENEPIEVAEEKVEKAAAEEVLVRISGTQGVQYSGSYGTPQGQRTVDGTLGVEPDEYDVEGVETGAFEFDVVTANFQKRSQGPEALRVEIVSGGEVVAAQETTAAFGVASVTWSPQNP